ncbi:DUF2963 domain-containing protein [Candidatus Phytoplasma pruni]|uniref:DUF2963 domain-containing protein n=1 Tax=Candidatus Phytoplasma pruni TaxID=479893 RepID=A0A851HCL6_9MOLU|nr:hypothetical protein [Candidatus Phytoplasma pruni]NWN45728.1 hypothetical protein [Candidatus Phytoplasma pruni]
MSRLKQYLKTSPKKFTLFIILSLILISTIIISASTSVYKLQPQYRVEVKETFEIPLPYRIFQDHPDGGKLILYLDSSLEKTSKFTWYETDGSVKVISDYDPITGKIAKNTHFYSNGSIRSILTFFPDGSMATSIVYDNNAENSLKYIIPDSDYQERPLKPSDLTPQEQNDIHQEKRASQESYRSSLQDYQSI